jgi:hypothetical protein
LRRSETWQWHPKNDSKTPFGVFLGKK